MGLPRGRDADHPIGMEGKEVLAQIKPNQHGFLDDGFSAS